MPDSTAAGEDDLGAVGIPGIGEGRNVSICNELVAINILQVNGDTQFLGSSIHTLNKAVAVTHDRTDCHTTQVADVSIAQLDNCVTGHVTCQMLLINGAVDIVHVDIVGEIPVVGVVVVGFTLQGNSGFQNITGSNVQSDEFYFRINFRNLSDGRAMGKTRQNNHIVTLGNSQVNCCNTGSNVAGSGTVVLGFNVMISAKLRAGFPGSLIERLVGDFTVVSNHSNLVGAFAAFGRFPATAGSQREDHDDCQQQCQNLFHFCSSNVLLIFFIV